MKNQSLACPECSSSNLKCLSSEFFLYECRECYERFSEEDAIVLREKSSKFRTRPRKGYDQDDDFGY